MPDSSERNISRRRALQAIGAATAVGAAGCLDLMGGDDDETAEDLGERVPEPIEISYFGGSGATAIMEDIAPILEENMEDTFETEVDIFPIDVAQLIGGIANDEREQHLTMWTSSPSPDRLDPDELIIEKSIDWAGENGRSNGPNYASCEYTHYAKAQATAESPERREELVHEADSIISEDLGTIPIMSFVNFGAYNSEMIDAAALGESGVQADNIPSYIESTPTDGDFLRTNGRPQLAQTRNFMTVAAAPVLSHWSHLFHSTLTEYDENWELQNMLAEEIEFEDEGRVVRVTLRDGTFHNGDPITAEDVQFTYTHLWDNPGAFPQAASPEYESIDVVDEKTVVFNMANPTPTLDTREWPKWGILHKETWEDAGAPENPEGITLDETVGSGPFEIVDFTRDQFIEAEPHDGHPVHEPDHGIVFEVFDEGVAAQEAFLNGDLHFLENVPRAAAGRITDDMPEAEITETRAFTNTSIYPQTHYSVGKFKAFREALAQCLDRSLMNEVALDGAANEMLHASVFGDTHPFYQSEDNLNQMVDDPSGDIEAARQTLEDAGWGWDDDGNLRYPADADTDPLWEEGSVPQPDDFDCLTAENEFEPTKEV